MRKEEDTVSVFLKSDIPGLEKPYQAALSGKWKDMKSFYNDNRERLPDPLTIDDDTAFHIAAYSAETELLGYLLGLLTEPSQIFEALAKKNTHGNNTFHEVATTNKVDAAELLIGKLAWACEQNKVHGSNLQAKLKELLDEPNKLGETPLYRAAALGQIEVLKVFANRVGRNLSHHFKRGDEMSILHIAVMGQHFETAVWLLGKDKELGTRKGTNEETCLGLLAKMPSAFKISSFRMGKMKTLLYYCLPARYYDDGGDSNGDEARTLSSQMEDLESGQGTTTLRQFNKHPSGNSISRQYCAIWRGLAEALPAIETIWKMKRRYTAAVELTHSLAKMDTTWRKSQSVKDKSISLEKADQSTLDDNVIYIKIEGEQSNTTERLYFGRCRRNPTINYTTPLLIAVSKGIEKIFEEILAAHPQAIEHITEDEENILHVAIRYRQIEIFRRVKKMKIIRDCRLAPRIDKRGYTILHHVADTGNYDGGTKPGPALQLQEELKWLERVRKIMPSHYVMHRNKDNKTADEFFKETHAELLKKAQNWIKETAQSCSAVAVLVATVVFAAAYTVPGGNNGNGYPNFLRNPIFLFFTIMDVISLASSLTSVVMFLSILTSPFEQENFHRSLPRKLMVGFTLLFFSVTTTVLSFSATILLIIRLEKKTWTTTLIYTAAFLPVAVFALMQFPLYLALTNSLHSLLKKIMKKIHRLIY